MVAEAPKDSTRDKQPGNRRAFITIPLRTKIKARNLYVSQGLGAEETAKACDLTRKQVYALADREGWTKLRREIFRKATESADARNMREIDALVDEVAQDTAELSLGTLNVAKEELYGNSEDKAKNLQAYSVAAKNFVGLWRQAKNLDVQQQGAGETNVLFIALTRVTAETQSEKRAEKCVEVEALPPAPPSS